MYLVEAHSEGRRWVSGVFALRRDAEEYLDSIPEAKRPRHSLRDLGRLEFPFFIVEHPTGFDALPGEEVQGRPQPPAQPTPDGEPHFNLYRIDADWRPPRAGTDYMGAIPHIHVTDEVLPLLLASGPEALF